MGGLRIASSGWPTDNAKKTDARSDGDVNDMRTWIQACDVLVNPSLSEGVPNVVLEAMALGTPTVATRVGGVPDLIEHLTSGLLVAPADPKVLADAILHIFANPSG